MNRFYALLLVGLVWLCASTTTYAQGPTFEMTPANVTASVNDVIAVQVKVKDFNSILSFQYSMEWNVAKLDYVNLGTAFGLQGLGASSIGTTQVAAGQLSVSWFDSNLTGVTLPDGTVIYTVNFKAKVAGIVDIKFSGNPVDIEVYNATDPNPISASTKFINIINSNTGGNTTQAVSISGGTASVATGATTCIAINAENGFTAIKKMKYDLSWDPTKLEIDQVKNFGLAGLSAANFNINLAAGKATLDWTGASAVTLPANTKLFDICFKALSTTNATATVTITPIEFVSGNANTTINPSITNGSLSIQGSGGGAPGGCSSTTVTPPPTCTPAAGFTGLGFKINTITASSGSNICIDVSTQDFTSVAGMQFSLQWDPSVLTYLSTKMTTPVALPNLSSSSNFDISQKDQGRLGFIWDDPTTSGVTLSNNTVLYQVCFAVIGSTGISTDIKFSGAPTTIEISTGAGTFITPKFQDGKINIEAPINLNGTITDVDCFGKSTGGITPSGVPTAGTFHYYWTGPNNFKCNDINLSGLPAGVYNLTVTSGTCQTATKTFEVKQAGTALTATTTVVDANNCDGSSTIVAAGGTPNYTYKWVSSASPGQPISLTTSITSKCESEYKFTVTDAKGCTVSNKVYIATALSFDNIVVTNIKCNGEKNGALRVIPKGGSGTYTYKWAAPLAAITIDSVTNLSPGTYAVTITDGNGKTISAPTIKVVEPAVLTASVITKTPAPNGSVEVKGAGGTGQFKYKWSNNQTASTAINLDKGTYSVTVTDDNGCTTVLNNIDVLGTVLTVLTQNVKKATCELNNGSAEVVTTGGSGDFAYLWSPGGYTTAIVNSLTPGSYTVTVTDKKWVANVIKTVVIDKVEKATVALASKTDAGSNCNGTINITVDKGTPQYTFQWTGPNNFKASTQNIANVCDGAYTVIVTDGIGCQTTQSFSVDPGGVNATAVFKESTCPTTADGNIVLTVGGGNAPYTYKWSNNATTKDLTSVAPGTYKVTITDNSTPKLSKSLTYVLKSKSTLAIDTIQLVLPSLGCAKSDGAATVVVSGGTPSYTYQWSGAGSGTGSIRAGLACGAYTVSVTDKAGCTVAKLFTLSDDSPVQIIALTNFKGTNLKCYGDKNARAQVVSIKGGKAPYTYKWSSGSKEDIAGGLSAGVYKVSVTDATGTEFVGSVTVIEPDKLEASLKVTDIVTTKDGTAQVVIKGGTSPYVWTWSDAAKTQNVNPLTGLEGGTIAALVRDDNGCETMAQAEIRRPGVNCLSALEIVTPNGDGKNDLFYIHCLDDFSNKSNQVEVFNRWGQMVFTATNYANTWECKTAEGYELPEGAYYFVVRVTKTDGTIESKNGYFNLISEK